MRPSDEVREIAESIGTFYLNKHKGDYEKASEEVVNLQVNNIVVLPDGSVEIYTARPGMLIGKLGKNVDALTKHLGKQIKIKEVPWSITDLILPVTGGLLDNNDEVLPQDAVAFASIKARWTITTKQVRSLLCSALEGGSNYWIANIKRSLAPDESIANFREGGKYQEPNDYWHPDQIIPTVEGCYLLVTADDDKEYRLGLAELKKGLQLMAEKQPNHWRDFITENDDAITGNVFLQMCLFGEVVYS